MEENTRRPVNPRRRRKTKMEIIKEAYLPVIILAITAIIIVIFIIGALVQRSQRQNQPVNTEPPTSTGPTTDANQRQIQQLLQEAEKLAQTYDYKGAADLLDTFSGDSSAYPELQAKKAEYLQADAQMVSWEPNQITSLSFHMLIADPTRAFANQEFGKSYYQNFVTVSEFSKILQQLYDNGYILVDLEDYTTCETDQSGHVTCAAKELKLPLGKKPLLLVQTNVNYYTYMVDGDGDGEPDKNGAGFASRMIVDDSGKITCEMVDASGNTVTGAYDLVPILDAFLAEHPDFSYKGAKAILAVSGYNGVFGYRTDAATAERKGAAYHTEQVSAAQTLVEALKADGYRMACYTYNNVAYDKMEAQSIQSDLQLWANEVTPVLGSTDILVFAQNSGLTEYSGGKFNVLQNAGFHYLLGFGTGTTGCEVGNTYVAQKRLTVTGSQMANSTVYSSCFDAASVLDPSRAQAPV